MKFPRQLSILFFLGSVANLVSAFEITTASIASFETHGFHCEFVGTTVSQRIFFNDGGVASSGALIGIDGKTVLLPEQRLRWAPKRREGPRVNDRFEASFSGGGTSMDISAMVLKSCNGMPENCERWQYDTTLRVKHNGVSRTLKGVSECGA